jgi:two-component system, chemotaxis family, chemotaxis protein CheY
MKALITDDSATIRLILKGLLKQLQITEVIEASNGHQALSILEKQDVDFVLLDIHMPVMDGLGCLEALRSHARLSNLPVIMVSSDTAEPQIERAQALGAHAYIKKPFRVDGMREALLAVCPAVAANLAKTNP